MVRLQVTAPGFTEIERFRELAGKRFEVQQGEVRSTEGKVEGALVLWRWKQGAVLDNKKGLDPEENTNN
jgi:hypothetical protein